MELDALYYGDRLDGMERWPDRSVDLIYLDPSFNPNASYNIPFGRDGDAGGGAQYRPLHGCAPATEFIMN